MASPTKSSANALPKDGISRLSKSEATAPVTPPNRYISSNLSTPGSTYGTHEDAIVIKLSSRCLQAGIEGESYPQCRYDFKPTGAKRLGDYRQWLPGYIPPQELLENWGEGYELWKNDLKNFELGVISDKLERAIREVYNKHLLVDAGNARLVLVVPSLLPHPVLSTILETLFQRWTYPSITLLPTPATALVSAGLRSGLVVDVGWEETVVTAIYEYREVRVQRSTRAMKMATQNFVRWAKQLIAPDCRLNLEAVETFLAKSGPYACQFQETEESEDATTDIEVEWPTQQFTKRTTFPRHELHSSLKETLLGKENEDYLDDEEQPLQWLIYKALFLLPADIRGICISRIVFMGEGTDCLQPQSLIIDAFSKLLETRGWIEVQGEKVRKKREGLSELAQARAQPADVKHDDVIWAEKAVVEERHLREKAKHQQTAVHGVVRQVETLGAWAGASLLSTLKVKSFVEIQRDRFLSHGLAGASRDLNTNIVTSQTQGTVGVRTKAGERTSWTLSGWG